MKIEKCPVCGSDTLELEKEHGDYYDCRICFFRCAPHNLPCIAAAMDLAKTTAAEHYHPCEHTERAFDMAYNRVMQVFKEES